MKKVKISLEFDKGDAPLIKIFSDNDEAKEYLKLGKYKGFVWEFCQLRRNLKKYWLENMVEEAKNKEELAENIMEKFSEMVEEGEFEELFDF